MQEASPGHARLAFFENQILAAWIRLHDPRQCDSAGASSQDMYCR
jgi:hypothetical protein